MYEYFLSSNPKNTPFLAFGKNFDFVLCIIPVITQTTKSFLNVLTLFFFVYKILHWVLKINKKCIITNNAEFVEEEPSQYKYEVKQL